MPQTQAPISEEAFKAIPVKPINQSAPTPLKEEENGNQLHQTPVAPVSQLQVDLTDQAEMNHEQELESLASLAQKRATNVLAEKKKNRLKRSVKFELPTGTWVIILCIFATLTFSIGMLVGRNMSATVSASANAN